MFATTFALQTPQVLLAQVCVPATPFAEQTWVLPVLQTKIVFALQAPQVLFAQVCVPATPFAEQAWVVPAVQAADALSPKLSAGEQAASAITNGTTRANEKRASGFMTDLFSFAMR